MEIFDKAKYHADGDFPTELTADQAHLPGGLFIAWCAQAGLLSVATQREFAAEIQAVRLRQALPCSLYRAFGGVFTESHLNEQGNAFAHAYFDFDTGSYLDDYVAKLAGDIPSAYHVQDTWASFDALAPTLDQRLRDWVEHGGTSG